MTSGTKTAPGTREARLTALFEQLDRSEPRLAEARDRLHAGATEEAALALQQYAAARQLPTALRPDYWGSEAVHLRRAALALDDVFELQDVQYRQPRRADGGLDWSHRGPNGDPEWSWFLNRHGHFHSLHLAWRKTGDPRYQQLVESHLHDWIPGHPRPKGISFSATWRPLEAARRCVNAWLDLCFPADGTPFLSPWTTALMWSSIPDHAYVLRHRHTRKGNHLLTEMSSLATIALAWPQFHDAQDWLTYATRTFMTQLQEQVYPDGSHAELSNHYQRIVTIEVQRFSDVLEGVGRLDLAPGLSELLDAMWSFFAGGMRPDGFGPLNNDGSLDHTARSIRAYGLSGGNEERRFFATYGRKGKQPSGVPSRYYPWAGQAITRSSWKDRLGQWARFDLGPQGIDHRHSDRLSIELVVGNRLLLADPGRYTYRPGPFRDYFTGAQGHNVLRLDDRGAVDPPDRFSGPSPAFVERTATAEIYAGQVQFPGMAWRGVGAGTWTRALVYLPAQCWLVVDRVTGFGARRLTAAWHFGPDCTVARHGAALSTIDPGLFNLAVLALGAQRWETTITSGQTDPVPKGWYSRRYNERTPSPVAELDTVIDQPVTFAWLLYPFKDREPEAVLNGLDIGFTQSPGGREVRFELDDDSRPDERWQVGLDLSRLSFEPDANYPHYEPRLVDEPVAWSVRREARAT